MAGLYIVVLDKRIEEANKRVAKVERDINRCQVLIMGVAVVVVAAFMTLPLLAF